MDIYLSGDIRKDKRVDGYVLSPNHYPNFLYFSGVSSIGSGAQYYNVVLDAFDYSGNFIERKAAFYDRGSTSGGAGIDIYWNNIGYSYNLYLSGSSSQFSGFSGITTTSNSYDYTLSNQYNFTLNGLPNYTGLTTTSATTLSGNVLIKAVSATTYLLQYNVTNNADFMMDVFKYNDRVDRVNTPGTYNHYINMSGITSTNLWLDFFIRSTDEVRLNNIKLFSIQ
jgi:hypothetical protein